jgi:transposase
VRLLASGDTNKNNPNDARSVAIVIAAAVIDEAGDTDRFADRDRFAAYNGTAPIKVSSGNRKVHGLSRRRNRRLNHAVRSGSGRRHGRPLPVMPITGRGP